MTAGVTAAMSRSMRLRLSGTENPPETEQRYVVKGVRWGRHLEIAVVPPRTDPGPVECFPPTAYCKLWRIAEDVLDHERLEADLGRDDETSIGRLSLSRVTDETVRVNVEWDPRYVASSTHD